MTFCCGLAVVILQPFVYMLEGIHGFLNRVKWKAWITFTNLCIIELVILAGQGFDFAPTNAFGSSDKLWVRCLPVDRLTQISITTAQPQKLQTMTLQKITVMHVHSVWFPTSDAEEAQSSGREGGLENVTGKSKSAANTLNGYVQASECIRLLTEGAAIWSLSFPQDIHCLYFHFCCFGKKGKG